MSKAQRLMAFLKSRGAHYEVIPHAPRATALGTAMAEKVPSEKVLKVVMAKIDGRDTMFVLPADRMLDRAKVQDRFDTRDIHIERETDFRDLFPDCETGAMPPFGSLYNVPCYVDLTVEKEDEVYFNAGSHEESVRIPMRDYLALAQAHLGDYTVPRKTSRLDI